MKRLTILLLVVSLTVGVARMARAEPAWGVNCLSCHGVWYDGAIEIFGEDGVADPDESATGAPDRGELPFFQVTAGQTATLTAEVLGLLAGDTYAVELKRLRFPGVVVGHELTYTDDCDWAYWGEPGKYYTDPAVGYTWGAGPTTFAFDLQPAIDAQPDFYDVVFTVAGKLDNGVDLFYHEQHFYVQITSILGDMDADGDVDSHDFEVFTTCFTGTGGTLERGCEAGDFDADADIDCLDFRGFCDAWTEPGDPPTYEKCRGNAIPTVSDWGVVTMLLLLTTAGTLIYRGRETQAD
jgi:hypothetical protein